MLLKLAADQDHNGKKAALEERGGKRPGVFMH